MRAARMVGVDLGSTEVRVVEVKGIDSRGFAVISRIGIAPLKEGSIQGGRIKNHHMVSVALLSALKAAGVSTYGFVVGISSPEVAVTRMALPAAIKREEREAAIRNMDRTISPTIPMADSVISTNLVRVATTGDGVAFANLAVAAALSGEVDAITKVCKIARCSPRAVDLSGAALMRAIVRAPATTEDIHTAVDIGATKITVVTRQGLHLRSIRSAAGGGSDITRALVAATGEDMVLAERRKMSMRLGSAPLAQAVDLSGGYGLEDDEAAVDVDAGAQTAAEEGLSNAAEAMVEQIASSIEHDSASGGFTQLVSLCGGTALLRGLKERLHQRVGVPVSIGRPWAVIEPSKRNAQYFNDGVEDPRLLLSLATAVGLALWKEPS